MLALICPWALGSAGADTGEAASIVEIPVRIPLAPLFAEVERLVPTEVRRDREWGEYKGVKVRYAARRGPLEIQARGDTLFLRATVAYWLEARKPVLGRLSIKGSCGIDEPPRAVVLSLADAAAVLARRLAGQRFTWAGKSVVVEQATLTSGPETMAIEAVVSGDLVGTVRLAGQPAFDPDTRELYLAGLDYQIETDDERVQNLDRGLHDLVRGVIATRARWPIADRIAAFQEKAA